jgi:hypothetical protein
MTRDQLARVFPDGRTVHIPSDGQPLSGYALALAEVERRGGSPSSVSLAAARGAGVVGGEYESTASTPKRGSTLARLFGFASNEEDDAEEAAPRIRTQPAVLAARQETAPVPMPHARPPRSGEYQVASAGPRSVADVINSRGFWGNDDATGSFGVPPLKASFAEPQQFAAAPAAPSGGPRLAWIAGPQGQAVVADAPMPRPRRPVSEQKPVVATAASVAAWQAEPSRNDRVPTDLVLAYAANPGPDMIARAVPPLLTAGSRANAVMAKKKTNAPLASAIGQRHDNPWLRGLVIAPSIERSMNVLAFGATDYRQLRDLIYKPRMAVAMVFSRDPYLGMTATAFSGGAVAFLPTVTFIRTASLY